MTDESVVLAFDKKKADARKTWLLESTAKDANQLEVSYGNIKQLNISEFIHKDLVNFSLADLKRSIAHVADGPPYDLGAGRRTVAECAGGGPAGGRARQRRGG